MATRRQFVLRVLPAASALIAAGPAAFAQPARLDEKDPQAVGLGYKHDATKVDAKKYPQWAAGHNCANCQLYLAKPADSWGPCGAVGGKLVNAKGWCIAWVKKA